MQTHKDSVTNTKHYKGPHTSPRTPKTASRGLQWQAYENINKPMKSIWFSSVWASNTTDLADFKRDPKMSQNGPKMSHNVVKESKDEPQKIQKCNQDPDPRSQQPETSKNLEKDCLFFTGVGLKRLWFGRPQRQENPIWPKLDRSQTGWTSISPKLTRFQADQSPS